jgi:hypothetical protein
VKAKGEILIGKFDILATYAVEEHVSYKGVKRKVRIPSIWGARITADDFIERVTSEKT